MIATRGAAAVVERQTRKCSPRTPTARCLQCLRGRVRSSARGAVPEGVPSRRTRHKSPTTGAIRPSPPKPGSGNPETANERRSGLPVGGSGEARASGPTAAAQARSTRSRFAACASASTTAMAKRRAVLRVIEAIYDQLGPRSTSASPSIRRSGAHPRRWHGARRGAAARALPNALGSRSNALIAICTVQACLEDLTLASQ